MTLAEIARNTAGEVANVYHDMPPEIAGDAQEIVLAYRSFQIRSVEAAVEIGRRLVAVQERLERGLFVKWLEAEFGSTSSAYRLMSVAQNIPTEKLPTVGKIGVTLAYSLAAPMVPADVRNAILEQIDEAESVNPQEIRSRLAVAKRAEIEARRKSSLTPEQIQRRKEREARQEKEWQRQKQREKNEQQQKHAYAEAAAQLIYDHMENEIEHLFEIVQKTDAHLIFGALRQKLRTN